MASWILDSSKLNKFKSSNLSSAPTLNRTLSTYRLDSHDGSPCVIKIFPTTNDRAIYQEIDILTRLDHPFIIHGQKISISESEIKIYLPIADRSFADLIKDPFLVTERKLSLLYKIGLGLNFLHHHRILHLNINLGSVVVRDQNPYLVDFDCVIFVDDIQKGKEDTFLRGTPGYQAPELFTSPIIYNYSIDVWAFGILILQVLNPKFKPGPPSNLTFLLQGIRPKYQESCKKLLENILIPEGRPSMSQIIQNVVFNPYRDPGDLLLGTVIDRPLSGEYCPDHRPILKLIPHWSNIIYPTAGVDLLFLSIDLFYRLGPHLSQLTETDRMAMAVTCLWMSSKLTGYTQVDISTFLTTINELVPHITPDIITQTELKILNILEGRLYYSPFYSNCSNEAEITYCFANILMTRDPNLYRQTDPLTCLQSANIPPNDKSKQILIGDLMKT